MNYNKYENYIRVGHTFTEPEDYVYICTDLEDFPTPSSLSTTLNDEDKEKIYNLIETLEDLDDVQDVYHNMEE